jgi:hypothetical protein
VVPANFPEWSTVMNQWGSKLLTAVSTVAEMLALGLELDQHAFTQLMHCAPHLLAPTGTNLAKHGAKDTIYAGFHYDLSFLTIHGKSRFPGLYIWLRTGKKMLVRASSVITCVRDELTGWLVLCAGASPRRVPAGAGRQAARDPDWRPHRGRLPRGGVRPGDPHRHREGPRERHVSLSHALLCVLRCVVRHADHTPRSQHA